MGARERVVISEDFLGAELVRSFEESEKLHAAVNCWVKEM